MSDLDQQIHEWFESLSDPKSEQRVDVEHVISHLETLLSYLKRFSNSASRRKPQSKKDKTSSVFRSSLAPQSQNISVPQQIWLKPAERQYIDVVCSSLIPNVKLTYGVK